MQNGIRPILTDSKAASAAIIIAALALAVGMAIGGFLKTYFREYVTGRIVVDLRTGIADNLLGLSMDFYDKKKTGEILSRMTYDVKVAQGSVEVVLAVCVGRSGNLSELFVMRSSGIGSYDHEAMRTVRASAPFAAPPDKFTADDGVLRMMWTFTVYL